MNWSEKTALLGEARWTSRPIGIQVLDELKQKSSAVVPDAGWHVHYALFSRSGFTEALQDRAKKEGVLLFDFATILATIQ